MHVELNEKFLVDDSGSRVAVLIDMPGYHRILEALEELESIHAFDKAKSSNDEVIPFEQAIREIESQNQ